MTTEEKLEIAVAALESIVNPIKHMVACANKAGYVIDGSMTVLLAKSPEYYKELANDALTKLKE